MLHPHPSPRHLIAILPLMLSCAVALGQAPPRSIPLTDARLQLIGQVDTQDATHPRLAYPATGLLFRFTGKSVELHLASTTDALALTVVVNHAPPLTYLLAKGEQSITIAATASTGVQQVEVYKRGETWQGILTLQSLALPGDAQLLAPPPLPHRKLLFIGDSVTCGAGMSDNATCVDDHQHPANNAYETYGMRLGRRLDAESRLVCYGGRGLQRDYLGHEAKDNVLTIPQIIPLAIASDAASERAPWNPARWQPNAIIVSIGTNDFSLQSTKPLDPTRWVGDYVAFVKQLRAAYPTSLIYLTEGSIVTDPLLRKYVQQTVETAADPQVRYLKSEHYPGTPCNGHPTESQHNSIANDFEPTLRTDLGW